MVGGRCHGVCPMCSGPAGPIMHSDRRTAITDSRAPTWERRRHPQVGVLFIDVVSARPSRRRVNGLRRRMRLTTSSCPVEIQVSPHHSGWLGMVTVQP